MSKIAARERLARAAKAYRDADHACWVHRNGEHAAQLARQRVVAYEQWLMAVREFRGAEEMEEAA